jgi:hypothetical protein
VTDQSTREPIERDTFICCAEPVDTEMPATIAAYLKRRGFTLFLEDRPPAPGAGPSRLDRIESIPDFLLLLTPATVAALSDPEHAVHAEVARALASRRNVVRVTRAGEPPPAAGAVPPALATLASQQARIYDPDRLAESLSLIQHSLSSDSSVTDRHLMRRTKRLFIFAAVFVFVGFSLQTFPPLIRKWMQPKPLPPVAPLVLYWSGFAQRSAGGAWAEFPLETGSRISGGDQLRVSFSPSANGFAYVVGKDSRGRVFVLFPAEAIRGASRVRAGRVYSAPVETSWLTIDPQAGLDAIYVFASYDPLQNLEELVEEPETPATIGARRELVDQTIAGLLDGRHYQIGRRVWIRTTQFVDQGLKPPAGPARFSAPLGNGAAAEHLPTVQPGLVSALGEIKVAFAAPRTQTGGAGSGK